MSFEELKIGDVLIPKDQYFIGNKSFCILLSLRVNYEWNVIIYYNCGRSSPGFFLKQMLKRWDKL